MTAFEVFQEMMDIPQNAELAKVFQEVVKELMAQGWRPSKDKMYEEMTAILVMATLKWGQTRKKNFFNNDNDEDEKPAFGFVDFKKAA